MFTGQTCKTGNILQKRLARKALSILVLDLWMARSLNWNRFQVLKRIAFNRTKAHTVSLLCLYVTTNAEFAFVARGLLELFTIIASIKSSVCRNTLNVTSSGEYILADSAYKASPTVVPCYRTDSIQATREEIERFNMEVNKTRVPIEHCNGILKGKFQSLQDLRIRINSSASLTEAGFWVRASCVMHDFLLDDSVDIEECKESCRQETSAYRKTNQGMIPHQILDEIN